MGFARIVLNTLFTSIIIVLFVLSGVVANALWTAILPLWFLHRDMYRSICKHITTAWFRIMIFIPIVWGKSTATLYTSDKLEGLCGKEPAIILGNHRYTHDWLLDFIVADRYSMLGQCKAFVKAEVAKVPFLGWAMWFNEYGFLSRANAKKDIQTLKEASSHLKDYNEPYWILLYPEGTRFTKEKHSTSIEFGLEHQIQSYENLLIPRSKGFHELTTSLRNSRVKTIYDITFYMDNDYDVSINHWLRGQPSNYTAVATTIDMDSIPTDAQESKKFLTRLYKEKDELLSQMIEQKSPSEYQLPNSEFYRDVMRRRPVSGPLYWKPVFTTAVWFLLIMIPILRVSFAYAFSSLKGFVVVVGVIVTMNIIVLYFINRVTGKSDYGNKKKN